MDSFFSCCSYLKEFLPDQGLKFIPALIVGTIASILILTVIHRKSTGYSFWRSLKELLLFMFVNNPVYEHDESMLCKNSGCIRCNKRNEAHQVIIDRWKILSTKKNSKEFKRIEDSVKKLIVAKDNGVKKKKDTEYLQKPSLFSMNLPAHPWWTDFDVYSIEKKFLKVNSSIICEEYEDIYSSFEKGNTRGWVRNEIPNGHWCIFPIIDQGVINEENCRRCPNTAVLITGLPSIMTGCMFGNVFFSMLYPGSHIEPHFGPSNIRIRCHFALSECSDSRLEICGKQYKWVKEECLIFDDSFEHSAFSADKKVFVRPRAVLLMDFWHPDISDDEKEILKIILAPNLKVN